MFDERKRVFGKSLAATVHKLLTFGMLMVACLLWGYLIGAYLQLHTSVQHQPTLATHTLPGVLSSEAGRALGKPSTEASEPVDSDRLIEMADEHSRFARRDRSFRSRLSYDNDFVLKNSF